MHRACKLALDDLGTFLSKRFSARRLTSVRAKQLSLSFTKGDYGWIIKTSILFEGQPLSIVVLPTVNFPYEVPKIYVKPDLPVLSYPHVEHNGKLCVWDNEVGYDALDIRYTEQLILDAHSLLEEVTTHQLDSDFDRGFLSYWMFAHPVTAKVNSLCRVGLQETKQVYVAYTRKKGTVFADSLAELKSWLNNVGIKPRSHMISKSFMLHIESPWLPSEYPKKLSQIIEIIRSQASENEDVYTLISEMLCAPTKYPMFLIQIPSESGNTVVGMCTETNAFITGNRKTEFRHPLLGNGFRANRVFPKQLFRRAEYLNLHGINVERNDVEWVLGRGVNEPLRDISTHKIGVVGLGSVGSGVLPILVRAGFSKFVLIDGDSLEAANIGRHWLGDPHVGMNKAKACEIELKRMFPWVQVIHAGEQDWFSNERSICELKQCDLIISSTGEWASDIYFGELLKQEELECPVLFAFTEPHAVATHCYLNHSGRFNFGKLFSNTGQLLTPVVKFSASTQKRLPTCGGYFQPYGGMELSFGHSMIAELATDVVTGSVNIEHDIHRIWVSSLSLVESNGGKWNEDWTSINGTPEKGAYIVTLKT